MCAIVGTIGFPAIDVPFDQLIDCLAHRGPDARHAAIYAEGSIDDQVNRMCQANVHMFLPLLNLAYTDRTSIAASSEVRVPFVDVEIVRAAFRLHGTDKIRGRTGKYALKKAAEAWLLRHTIDRPKALLSGPLRAWIPNDLREMLDDILPGGELVGRGYVKRAYVLDLMEKDRAGRSDYSKEIWHLLAMDYWLRSQPKTLGQAASIDQGRILNGASS